MSKLDELPEGCATWLDAACQTLAGFHPSLKQSATGAREARAELAALRQRAEDAELLLRAIFDAELNAEHPFDWYFLNDRRIRFEARFEVPFDSATGLPVLRDDVRKILRGELGDGVTC